MSVPSHLFHNVSLRKCLSASEHDITRGGAEAGEGQMNTQTHILLPLSANDVEFTLLVLNFALDQ
jgi:hypothetical protein